MCQGPVSHKGQWYCSMDGLFCEGGTGPCPDEIITDAIADDASDDKEIASV
jgi:hypothetical protein